MKREQQPRWRRVLRHPLVLISLVAAWIVLVQYAPTRGTMRGLTLDRMGMKWWKGDIDRRIARRTLIDRCYLVPESTQAHRVVHDDELNSWEDREALLHGSARDVYLASFGYRYAVSGWLVPLWYDADWHLELELQRPDLYTSEELTRSPLPSQAAAVEGYLRYVASEKGLSKPELADQMRRGVNDFRGVVWWGWAWLLFLLAAPLCVARGLLDLPRFFQDWAAKRRLKREGLCACGYSRVGLAKEAACPECGVAPGRVIRVGTRMGG